MGRRKRPSEISKRKKGYGMKKWLQAAAVIAAAGILTGLAGASWSEQKETAAEEQVLEYTELTLCLIGNAPDDIDMVMEKFNELTKRDLNCTVQIKWVVWGDFETKYPMLLSIGENIDLIYAANWLGFYENAQRGAFAPLEELLETYAPESYEALTDEVRELATVNGHLYALPANYTNYNLLGVIVRGDLMEKYQIEAIETFEDYLEFCEVMAEEEGIDPTGMCSMNTDMINLYLMEKGYYPVDGSTLCPYWINLKDKDYQVYFQSECPGAEEFLKNAKTWYEKGYWTSNVLVSKDETLLDSGLAASRIHNYDAYLGEYGMHLDWDLQYYNLADPIVRQTVLQDAMAIPATSGKKERAMMLLEKLRNDEEYYMLLTYGIEGYHYRKEGRKIEFLNGDYGNEPGTWGFREEKFKCWDSVLPEEVIGLGEEFEENAVDTQLVNFDLDLSTIHAEYTAIKEVMSVYYNPLKLGYIDYEEGLHTLNQQLKDAGNEEVKQEIQRQIKAFLKH